MINERIFQLADELKSEMKGQIQEAKKALESVPEGQTKDSLTDLLKRAQSGDVDLSSAQKEIQEILKNAG